MLRLYNLELFPLSAPAVEVYPQWPELAFEHVVSNHNAIIFIAAKWKFILNESIFKPFLSKLIISSKFLVFNSNSSYLPAYQQN